jgi:hypothetical protein
MVEIAVTNASFFIFISLLSVNYDFSALGVAAYLLAVLEIRVGRLSLCLACCRLALGVAVSDLQDVFMIISVPENLPVLPHAHKNAGACGSGSFFKGLRYTFQHLIS